MTGKQIYGRFRKIKVFKLTIVLCFQFTIFFIIYF